METLFQPEELASIAGMVGVQLNENEEDAQDITEEEKEELESNTLEDTQSSITCYNIRKGREEDVLKDNRKTNKSILSSSSCISEYSYEDFQKEFIDEKTNEDLYEDDSRTVAEYEIQDGGTYEAGRVLDKEYAVLGNLSCICFSLKHLIWRLRL